MGTTRNMKSATIAQPLKNMEIRVAQPCHGCAFSRRAQPCATIAQPLKNGAQPRATIGMVALRSVVATILRGSIDPRRWLRGLFWFRGCGCTRRSGRAPSWPHAGRDRHHVLDPQPVPAGKLAKERQVGRSAAVVAVPVRRELHYPNATADLRDAIVIESLRHRSPVYGAGPPHEEIYGAGPPHEEKSQ